MDRKKIGCLYGFILHVAKKMIQVRKTKEIIIEKKCKQENSVFEKIQVRIKCATEFGVTHALYVL